jgi:hypothetical protein
MEMPSSLVLLPERALGTRWKAGSVARKSLFVASLLILSIIYSASCMLLSGLIIDNFFKIFIQSFSAHHRRQRREHLMAVCQMRILASQRRE